MEVISCQQMKEADSYAINTIGIPSIVLMENAALKVVNNIDLGLDCYAVVCSRGNNGGDGLTVARHLILKNKKVKIYIAGKTENGTEDFNINLRIIENLQADISFIRNEKDLTLFGEDLKVSDLTIDALFGIGLNRNVEGLYYDIIKIMNEESKKIIAVDVPSGLNGDTGKAMGISVKAYKTVTFHKMKSGLLNSGVYTGDVVVEDIGIPG
ncbi:NAD(P)H-hydrate epimerase [Sedimentibacter sp. MB31-C6]|uniref:NAD(P)H-hydrate epimerase n=1 Tax=Sedimentibacter sp. MB31-C6 TaxID=3109366 RepID=UPI002DDD63EF|nr:NAD(P)H-hydrate epimerase [Sedimentibacter sp. MB36-C1]WSI04031.1 NAD(P)H-hydrate epimerase [Sedimentibacter sp. MB36-C1]